MNAELKNVTLAANSMAREIEQLKKELSEYEVLSPQQCPKGVHADWLVDSEYAHACPWCQIEELRAQLAELAHRARRVAISHEHFIQDHSDPGSEALGAQYELINWLSASDYHEGLPAHPVETALRLILAHLDEVDDEVNPRWIRGTIAGALPREDMSDRRRRLYIDGHGDGWIDQSLDSDGAKWLVQLSSMAAGGCEPKDAVAERTGSLREIGRCW